MCIKNKEVCINPATDRTSSILEYGKIIIQFFNRKSSSHLWTFRSAALGIREINPCGSSHTKCRHPSRRAVACSLRHGSLHHIQCKIPHFEYKISCSGPTIRWVTPVKAKSPLRTAQIILIRSTGYVGECSAVLRCWDRCAVRPVRRHVQKKRLGMPIVSHIPINRTAQA